MTAVAVEGTCAEGFEAVRAAFAANIVDPGEIGAAAAAVVERATGGRPVMNQLTASLGADRRSRRLVAALYSCL